MITKTDVKNVEIEKLTPEEKKDIMSTPVENDKGNKIYVDEDKDEWVVEKKIEPKSEKKEEPVKVETPINPFEKLERELAKEEGKEDLKDFTPTEKAYYHQMRRDRKQRQRAEQERDEAKFRELKFKKEMEEKNVPKVEQDEDIFKDRALDDLLTVEDIKKLMAKDKRKPVIEPKKDETSTLAIDINNPSTRKFLELCDKEARQTYTDYEEVIELSSEIISNNIEYQKKIAESHFKGENPAIRMYELIKSDAEFEKLYPVAKTRVNARKGKAPETQVPAPAVTTDNVDKEKKAREAQEALERNKEKVRTSAHAVGSEDKNTGELTTEELFNMDPREFAKLPKKQRDSILRKYGSEPNYDR